MNFKFVRNKHFKICVAIYKNIHTTSTQEYTNVSC